MAPVVTNSQIYREIALEAYGKMDSALQSACKPKPGGEGYVLAYNPERDCFKEALIAVAFTGMWLEAELHLLLIAKFGKQKATKHDKKKYEVKLELLGINTTAVLEHARLFRAVRNEITHEKGDDYQRMTVAQDAAYASRKLMYEVECQIRFQHS